jgi:hypothetical protein
VVFGGTAGQLFPLLIYGGVKYRNTNNREFNSEFFDFDTMGFNKSLFIQELGSKGYFKITI